MGYEPARYRLHLDIYDGNTLFSTVKAGEFRQNLFQAGKGNGKHAFNFAVPSCLKDGKPHLIRVKVQGTDFDLGSTPIEINCKQEIAERRIGMERNLPKNCPIGLRHKKLLLYRKSGDYMIFPLINRRRYYAEG